MYICLYISGTERQCEELVDTYTSQITSAIRDDLNHTQFVSSFPFVTFVYDMTRVENAHV